MPSRCGCPTTEVDAKWIEGIFGFAIVPDLVLYLDVKPEVLAERVLGNLHYLDYWESGMDIHRDGDMYASFISYQKQVREQFLSMAPARGFHIIDGDRDAEEVTRDIKDTVESTIDLP